MKCELMHRAIPAAEIDIDSDSGSITKIYNISAPEHLPVGVIDPRGKLSGANLNQWWTDRSIPASRSGLRDALDLMGIADSRQLLIRFMGSAFPINFGSSLQELTCHGRKSTSLIIRFQKISVIFCLK